MFSSVITGQRTEGSTAAVWIIRHLFSKVTTPYHEITSPHKISPERGSIHEGPMEFSLVGCHETIAIIMNIIRVKIRIIRRVIFHDDGVLKPDSLESDIPVRDTQLHVFSPLLGNRGVHVPHDRFYRFYQLSRHVLFHILGLQIPPIDNPVSLQTDPDVSSNNLRVCSKKPITLVRITGSHRGLRQDNDITSLDRGQGAFLVCRVSHHALHDNIILERLELLDLWNDHSGTYPRTGPPHAPLPEDPGTGKTLRLKTRTTELHQSHN